MAKLAIARVLVSGPIQGVQYEPNTLVQADESLLKDLHEDGIVSGDPAHVSYCKKQGAKVISHAQRLKALEPKEEVPEDDEGEIAE